MKVELTLTTREAKSLLRAELIHGYGVRKSVALQVAEMKLRHAVINALEGSDQ